jgi:branched-chain amino acid aminotransferase
MECFGNYYYLDGNIFPASSDDEITAAEVSFYEVIRTRGGVPLFFVDHIKRLNDGIGTRYDLRDDIAGKITEGLETLVRQESFPEINVRITVSFTGQEYSLHICYIPSSYPTEEMIREGVPLIMYRAERFDPGVKLLNNRLRLSVNESLARKKAYEALLVNKEGYITEGSRSNVFFVTVTGKIYTAPDRMVLSGITRKYVIDLCRKDGFDLVFEAVKASELKDFQSVFITGTSPMVIPVISIDNHLFVAENAIVERLRLLYRQLADDSIMTYQRRKKTD